MRDSNKQSVAKGKSQATNLSAPAPRHTERANTLCKEVRKERGLPLVTSTKDLAREFARGYLNDQATDEERQNLIALIEPRCRDFIYRAYRKGDGEGYDAVFARASQGDTKSLLALLSVFPDAELEEPIRAQVSRALREKPEFQRKWRALNRATKVHPHTKRHLDLLYVLCLDKEMVLAHAAGQMTLQEMIETLDTMGFATQAYGTFATWLHRTFPDIYSCKS